MLNIVMQQQPLNQSNQRSEVLRVCVCVCVCDSFGVETALGSEQVNLLAQPILPEP